MDSEEGTEDFMKGEINEERSKEIVQSTQENEPNMDESIQDHISNLPDEVLLHIFSFLNLRCAVRISVLSTRWRELWMFSPRLDFSGEYPPKGKPPKFVIDRCLHLSSKFNLHCFSIYRFGKKQYPVDKWIDLLVRRGVKRTWIIHVPF